MCKWGSSSSDSDDSGDSGGGTLPYYCDGPFMAIKTQDDANNLVGCSTYSGSLTVDPSFTGDLNLDENPSEIDGDFTCAGVSGLTSISANALSTVHGTLALNSLPAVSNLSFSSLDHADGDFNLDDVAQLESLSLPLSSLGGSLYLHNLPLLSSLDLPELDLINDSLGLESLPALQNVDLPLSTIGGNIDLDNLMSLRTINMSSLDTVKGNMTLLSLPKLPSLGFGNKLKSIVSITLFATMLTQLSLMVLEDIQNLNVTSNNLLQEINLGSVSSVNGSIYLQNLPVISNITMTNVTSINETLHLEDLPELQELGFETTLKFLGAAEILDTALKSLLFDQLQQMGDFHVEKNAALTVINISSLTRSTANITVKNNGPTVALDLSNLQRAVALDLDDVDELILSSLSTIDTDVSVRLSSLSDLKAPVLTTIGKDLLVEQNPRLQTLSMPRLFSVIGDLDIANNSMLAKIDQFPLLSQVGSVDIEGSFSSLSFPSLSIVEHDALVLTSAANASICSYINQLHSDGIIHGTSTCGPQPELPREAVTGIVVAAVLSTLLVLLSSWRQWIIHHRENSPAASLVQDDELEP